MKGAIVLLAAAALLVRPAGALERIDAAGIITQITGDAIDMEVFPKPRAETYSGKALRLDNVSIDWGGQEDTPAARLLKELAAQWGVGVQKDAQATLTLGLLDAAPAAWQPDPLQGYRLKVKPDAGRPLIEIRAGGAAGLFYGVQTLRQLVHVKNGARYVREADIEDWPAVRFRGPASAGNARWKMNLTVVDTVWPPADPDAERRRDAEQELAETIKRIEELEAEKDEPAESLDDLIDGLLGEQDAGAVSEDEERARQELHRSNIRQKQRLGAELKRLEAAYERHKEEQLALALNRMQTWRDHHIEPVIQYNETTWSWGRISDSERLSSDHRNSVERLLRNLKTTYSLWYDLGARKFALRFDYGLFGYYSFQRPRDAEEPTDPNFGEVQSEVLHRIVDWLEELDPQNRFFLRHHKTTASITPAVRHVSGWRTKRDLDELAAELAAAGLPERLEIIWTGSGDPAPRLKAEDAQAMSDAFGGRPASFLNSCGTRLHRFEGAGDDGIGSFIGNHLMEPHDPELAGHLDIAHITGWSGRQWGWNPEGYDPDRTAGVMLREWLRGIGGPQAWGALAELARWQRENGHFAVTGWRGWHRRGMLAPDQGELSPEEVGLRMQKKREFYESNLARLREGLSADGSELYDRIEREVHERLQRMERVAEALKTAPVASAARTDGPIQLDGRLDEPAWREAESNGSFTGHKYADHREWHNPVALRDAGYDTVFRVTYDDENLYIAVHCRDPKVDNISPTVPDAVEKRPGGMAPSFNMYSGDHVTLVIDPTGRKRRGAYLTATVKGHTIIGEQGSWQFYTPPDPPVDWEWARDFRVATSVVDGGWIAEIAVPLEGLHAEYRPEPGRRWGFNVLRRQSYGSDGSFDGWYGLTWWHPYRTSLRFGHGADGGPTYAGQIIHCGTLVFE